ncbi:MAG: hypothetical protein HOI06_02855 [Pelagibacteraceae bacterium]|jgi:hypothetical protein|nr:hypothetical protein [Pelagibacteraceae bacterium]MBT3901920.1 hypothetical protein [Pelagibacteraceae bacterium]MBT4645772.1 hypothetical protein [Pelagibacteraceae bacterium]MBT4950590.1 hypothetical protein [Pelagibacteraceae bacterium]MBT5213617.1 hypothetical protein [Pelagibacteraceae bacterium]
MNEENLNLEIRKFLKKVGISSQRVIENYIIKAVEEGNLKKKDEVEIEMKMILKNQNIEHTISDKIKIE